MMYVGILVAAIAAMVVGALRYSPVLFGNMWMKEMGFTKKDMDKKKDSMGSMYAGHFVILLIQAAVLYYAIDYLAVVNYNELIQMTVVAWFALMVIPMSGSMIWEGKSTSLFLINAFHQLVALLVMVCVLYSFMMKMGM